MFLEGGLNQQRMGVSPLHEFALIDLNVTVVSYAPGFLLERFIRKLRWWLIPLQICDAVVVAKILNATLLLPHFDVNPVWKDSRYAIAEVNLMKLPC